MKRIITIIFFAALLFSSALPANAQMMNYGATSTPSVSGDKTNQEEAQGKTTWGRLQAKEVVCSDLSDDDFDVLGEYFMGQMMGSSHAAMNAMMVQMMGEQGETQMHIVMGKRLSGCDTSAAYPAGGAGFMPMMQMLAPYQSGAFGLGMSGLGSTLSPQGGSASGKFNFTNTMMNLVTFGFLGLLLMVIWWAFVIAVIVIFARWVIQKFKGGKDGESSLNILKERYAKGEIDKKEFHEKKKDLES